MLEVKVTARCFPTEDRAKVVAAISNIFPDFVPEGDDPVAGTARSTEFFAELLKKQRIRSVARAVMRRGVSGDSVSFTLNKQVATAGKVSFSEENHALGDIDVAISADDIERFIDEIAPRPGSGGVEGR